MVSSSLFSRLKLISSILYTLPGILRCFLLNQMNIFLCFIQIQDNHFKLQGFEKDQFGSHGLVDLLSASNFFKARLFNEQGSWQLMF